MMPIKSVLMAYSICKASNPCSHPLPIQRGGPSHVIDVAAAWRVDARHRTSIGVCLNTGAVVGDHHNNAGLVIPASHRLLLLTSQRISKPPAQCMPHVIILHEYRFSFMGVTAPFAETGRHAQQTFGINLSISRPDLCWVSAKQNCVSATHVRPKSSVALGA